MNERLAQIDAMSPERIRDQQILDEVQANYAAQMVARNKPICVANEKHVKIDPVRHMYCHLNADGSLDILRGGCTPLANHDPKSYLCGTVAEYDASNILAIQRAETEMLTAIKNQ